MMEFIDHYELVTDDNGDHVIPTFALALELAGNDHDKVWFVRSGDDDGDPDDEDFKEPVWDVELYHGHQMVNRLGFFVTTEPCKPEHRYTIFQY